LFVAQPTAGDLFIGAKDLFIAAMDGKGPSQGEWCQPGQVKAERIEGSALPALHH